MGPYTVGYGFPLKVQMLVRNLRCIINLCYPDYTAGLSFPALLGGHLL